jgi:hypothetical protein
VGTELTQETPDAAMSAQAFLESTVASLFSFVTTSLNPFLKVTLHRLHPGQETRTHL